jgi:hypothetical protein
MPALQDTRVFPGARSPSGVPQGSWKVDLALPVAPPTRVYVKSPFHTEFAMAELDEATSVGELKMRVHERLMLSPARRIRLFSWGRELADPDLLTEYALQTNARLDMLLVASAIDPERGLERVRVACSLLKTRAVDCDATTTVGELKSRIDIAIRKGEHEWYTTEGVKEAVRGATAIAQAEAKPDEKSGTSAVRRAEEFVIPGGLGDGKSKGALQVRKAESGRSATVADSNLVAIDIPPAKQRLTYGGVALDDDAERLWERGVRTDDVIVLEFESPVLPDELRVLRSPAAEKPKKGEGGAKEKGGKKKK